MLLQEQVKQQVKKDTEDSLLRSFDNRGMLNERKCKALVDISAPGCWWIVCLSCSAVSFAIMQN